MKLPLVQYFGSDFDIPSLRAMEDVDVDRCVMVADPTYKKHPTLLVGMKKTTKMKPPGEWKRADSHGGKLKSAFSLQSPKEITGPFRPVIPSGLSPKEFPVIIAFEQLPPVRRYAVEIEDPWYRVEVILSRPIPEDENAWPRLMDSFFPFVIYYQYEDKIRMQVFPR